MFSNLDEAKSVSLEVIFFSRIQREVACATLKPYAELIFPESVTWMDNYVEDDCEESFYYPLELSVNIFNVSTVANYFRMVDGVERMEIMTPFDEIYYIRGG